MAANLTGPKAKDRVLKELANAFGSPSEELLAGAIETGFRKALGRGPTLQEVERYGRLYRQSVKVAGNATTAKVLVTAILMQPEFLFRQELGDGRPDEFGHMRLSQREIAYALSYALSD